MTLKQLVTFCILMENNDGILRKSPAYIDEKFRSCGLHTASEDPDVAGLLDSPNKRKFDEYFEKWGSYV